MRTITYILHIVVFCITKFLQLLGHRLFSLYYRRISGIRVPPVKDRLLLIPACELAKRIATRQLRSEDVVLAYISRLRIVNPLLNAICFDRYDEALDEARRVDEQLDNEEPPEDGWPPLMGVPVTIKEAFAVKGFQQTGGLKYRIGCLAEEDAPAVANLKKAGAIILATTNISEMCMWWESHNRVYGKTKNPYCISSIVGGSSGGEAAVVGAGASIAGLGSDIGGSVRMPAFFCGVFGHKASTGITETKGQFPECDCQSEWYMITSGPICRYAADLPLLTSILLKPNLEKELRLFEPVDLRRLNYFSLEEWNPKLALTDGVDKELVGCQKNLCKTWERSLNTSVTGVSIPEFFYQFAMWEGMMNDRDNSKATLASSLVGDPVKAKEFHPLKELLKLIVGKSNYTFPGILLGVGEKLTNQKEHDDHKQQVKHCDRLRLKISKLLREDGVMFAPVHPKAGYFHHQTVLHIGNFSYTGIWNALGFPATAVPLGLSTRGLPLGVQIISNIRNDRLCLAVAKRIEEIFGGWTPP